MVIETQRTRQRRRNEPADAASIERGVRQLLADKVSGTLVGIWLLVAEHLRLGTWDLVQGWSAQPGQALEPRLALQLIHEAALCLTDLRATRSLSQKGFELANGLPFVASDQAIHQLLSAHTVAEAQNLQLALGKLRRASGHYQGRVLAIDPHHMHSYTQRQTRRHRHKENETAVKTVQTFFCLDVETGQPLALTIGSAARTVTQGTPGLLELVAAILQPTPGQTLVLADTEHFTAELLRHVADQTGFDLLIPMPESRRERQTIQSLPPEAFTPRWAGLATATLPFQFARTETPAGLWQIVQRCGEKPADYRFKSFVSTSPRDEVHALIVDYPQRWHVEEFFNANQALGWNRGGTLNLNIRYGQMTMALIAQAAIHGLRQRLGPPFSTWEASHLAHSMFQGLDGDIRVREDTIVVTFYNAPNAQQLRQHYENLPRKLLQENVDPRIPWLYDFKLDFRFK